MRPSLASRLDTSRRDEGKHYGYPATTNNVFDEIFRTVPLQRIRRLRYLTGMYGRDISGPKAQRAHHHMSRELRRIAVRPL